MNATQQTSGFSKFLIIWAGQFLSLIGSGLTGFGLGVWVFQQTGSSTYYALIVLFTVLPGLLSTPLGGVLADRYNKKRLMIFTNLGASLSILCLFILILFNSLEIWHIYVAMSFASIFTGLQYPAFKAAITDLVPKEKFAQASGLTQAAMGAQYIISPFIAGLMLDGIGIKSIMIVDFITFFIAATTLILTAIPKRIYDDMAVKKQSFITEFNDSIKYLSLRKGLMPLLIILTLTNIFQGMLVVLIGPMILSFTTAKALGIGQSIAGLGMLLTSIYVGIKGIKSNYINTITVFLLISGFSLFFMGLRESMLLIIASSFLFFFALPFINAGFETIWRLKTKASMHGRLFAFARTVTQFGLIIGYAFAGPLADNIFEPAFTNSSTLSSIFGPIIGVGKGRGIGMIFLLSGIFTILLTLSLYLFPTIRGIEKNLNDEPIDEMGNKTNPVKDEKPIEEPSLI